MPSSPDFTRRNFNPRPLMRGRRRVISATMRFVLFQSTPPHEGATFSAGRSARACIFQSTPPHEGATKKSLETARFYYDFNPRPLMRGRRLWFSALDLAP